MAAAADPSLVYSHYVLPPDYAIMGETAEVFTKALLLGMEPEAGRNNFADPEPVEILPFEEALAYMKKRVPVDKETYYALNDKMRYRAFTVGRLADADAVKRVQGMLAGDLEDGSGLNKFLQMTEGELADAAGMGRGAGWYYETVYRTNASTAYNVGRAIGFEEAPPIALELLGIDDARQTETCHALTVPPFRRPYGDPAWQSLWPPFHFNCRTTVRGIYDEAEIDEAGGPDKFYSRGAPDYTPDKGFGAYPVDKSDSWWDLTDAMQDRAGEYGLEAEFLEAKEKLVEPDKPALNEEKIAETLHKAEMDIKDLDHEEGDIVGLDGKHILHVKGTAHEVAPPPELVKGNIFTHNHPSGGYALSTDDVINIIEDDGYGVRAVTRDGRFVYLKKGTGELNKELGNDMVKAGLDGDNWRLWLQANKNLAQKGISAPTELQRTQEAANIVNQWLIDNAHKYGYIFTWGRV